MVDFSGSEDAAQQYEDFDDIEDLDDMDPFDDQFDSEQDDYSTHMTAASEAEVPAHLMYSPEHMWVDTDSDPATCGITAYAAEQLGELVFIDLPEVGTHVEVGDELLQLESSKSISPVVSAVSGTVAYVNHEAYEDPSVVNNDPYGEGWLVKITCEDDSTLLTAQEYQRVIG